MLNTKFIFNGGLGNQIFQYYASKYISNNIKSINISYSLDNNLLNGERKFELNNLIKYPLNITEKSQRSFRRINEIIANNLPLLNENKKAKIRFQLDLLNKVYQEELLPSKFVDPLLKLSDDLKILRTKIKNLKIYGYWQNPSSYINELDDYKNLIINTRTLLPENLEPNKYITIHIRRSDYFLDKGTLDFYFSKFSPIKFIISSIQLLPSEYKNMSIYFLSDDKIWSNKINEVLSNSFSRKFTFIGSYNHFVDWSILRHSAVNICSNSTFSYTAALLNFENKDRKLRCIIPQWINSKQTAYEKGWLKPDGFIDI